MNFDQSDVYALFSRHYFYFAALASLGALQIGVSTGGHRGLWLTPSRALTRAAGVALVLSGAALFFLMPLWVDGPWKAGSVEPDSATRQWGKADWGDIGSARNMNDIDGGLSGTGQATWFPLSAAIAVVISLGAGMVNRKLFPGSYAAPVADDEDGVETIGRLGYAEALKRSWNRFRRDLPGDAAELLAASDRWSITALAWRRWRK